MIKTATQLKAKVRNLSDGESGKAQLLIRNYAMERFLERISVSAYKDNFVVKGGILVAAMAGLDNRATMDIDATIRNFPLDVQNTTRIINEISSIKLNDNMVFILRSVNSIMDDADYSGLRVMLDAFLDQMKIPLKIDISTGDVITPRAVEYSFKLMFEDRTIDLWAYNIETILAEKLETIISRGVLNTRMRDYYDVYILQFINKKINIEMLKMALLSTSAKRNSTSAIESGMEILDKISNNAVMKSQWLSYRSKYSYVGNISWDDLMTNIILLFNQLKITSNSNDF